MSHEMKENIANGIFASFFLSIFLIGIACTPSEPQFDKVTFERVFLKCIETAKGPNSLTASGNDLDEAIAECRFTARQIAEK